MKKLKETVKGHKKKIAIAVGLAGVSAAIGYMLGKRCVGGKLLKGYDSTGTIGLPQMTMADFGKFGEEYMKQCPSIAPDTVVDGVTLYLDTNNH